MLLAGDEVLRSQGGNNNAWCQDNATSWFDWRLTERNGGFLRYTRELIAFRQRHPTLTRRQFLTGRPEGSDGEADIRWHGVALGVPPWDDPDGDARGVLACTLAPAAAAEEPLHVILNLGDTDRELPLPVPARGRWHTAIDTAAESPDDIVPRAAQAPRTGGSVRVTARSVVVLEAR
jgi:glycogen operon protein